MPARTPSSQLRRDYFWNSAASLMGSVSFVIMLTVVTRAAGVVAAGIFSLANAAGQQFQTLGMYEVRTYHVTDVRKRFVFGTYLTARIFTVALMIAGIVGYAVVSGGDPPQVVLVILVASLRVFDAFEDVFYSEFQRSDRLDIGGRACFWRILTTTAVFSIGLAITGNLLWSTIVTLLVSTAITAILYIPPARRLFSIRPSWNVRAAGRLLVECLPLFLASFLAMYLANAPRYAIDRYLDLEAQGYFSFLYMPAVAINLLSLLVLRPLLTRMAGHWSRDDWGAFASLIMRGLRTMAIAFVLVAAATWVVGVPVLALVFGTDLSPYRLELMVLVTGGAFNAGGVILYYGLATMRRQRFILLAYAIASAAAAALSRLLVPAYALMGATAAYTGTMMVLALVFAIGIGRARPRV